MSPKLIENPCSDKSIEKLMDSVKDIAMNLSEDIKDANKRLMEHGTNIKGR